MPSADGTVVLALVVIAQLVHAQGCRHSRQEAPAAAPPAPAPTLSPQPASEVFVTRDGVRFHAEVVASRLEISWPLNFAPDRRLFITERHGRVRITDIAAGSAELALTLDDVS